MKRVSIAIVGCGAISHHHLLVIFANDDKIYVTAAIDPDLAKSQHTQARCQDFQSKYSNPAVQVFSNLDEAIVENNKSFQEKGQFLFIAVELLVPHHLHHRLAITAIKAGLHVLIEKPLANTVAECQDILQNAKQEKSETLFLRGGCTTRRITIPATT